MSIRLFSPPVWFPGSSSYVQVLMGCVNIALLLMPFFQSSGGV